jgi:hypothetical protein
MFFGKQQHAVYLRPKTGSITRQDYGFIFFPFITKMSAIKKPIDISTRK